MDNTVSSALAGVSSVFAAYKQADAALDPIRKRKDRLVRLIERHQKAVDNLDEQLRKGLAKTGEINPYTNGRFIAPLAEAILAQFPGMATSVTGPYGLASAVCISIFDPAIGDTKDGMVGWAEFRYDDEHQVLGYVDFTQDTGDFPPNSIGRINGLNHPVILITPETTLEQLAEVFRRGV